MYPQFAGGIMGDAMVEQAGDLFVSPTSSSSSSDVTISDDPSSGSEFMEDASSSSMKISSSSAQLGGGPLYEMSNLMAHLPFKRGLSKHYDGKSQSFMSLADVSCLADVAKAENPYNRRLKATRNYSGNLDCRRPSYPPLRSSISKKTSRMDSCAASLIKRNCLVLICTKPQIPTQKHA